jgi:hypothetical protein
MVESRWLRWIGPGLVALGAVGLVASTTSGAVARPWIPRACAGPPGLLSSASRELRPGGVADLTATPWFRQDPVTDDGGDLRGQRLAVGLDGDRLVRTMDLPAESFAAGPFGGIVLVGSDDGTLSRLAAVDVANGCTWAIADERDIIRRATVDPTGTAIVEMRVDRATRADLGIWLRPIDGRTHARRIVEPIAADGRFGRTWSTEFTWSLAGDRLAIQSCGEAACRTRIIRLDARAVVTSTAMVDAPDLGLLVGVDGDQVVTYGACRGLPCPIIVTNSRSGARRELVGDAGAAVLVDTPDGARLVHEQRTATGRHLQTRPLDGQAPIDLGPIPDDTRLQPAPVAAGAATTLPPGWVLLAPDGRIPADPAAPRPILRHLPDGLAVPLDEDAR